MTDTSVFLWINGLAGKVSIIDEFFKGISNDYFSLIGACLVLIWLWFAARDVQNREIDQRAVMAAIISIGVVSGFVALCNEHYFRPRPFNVLPADSINLLFYQPTDSSFPSNLASVVFAIAVPVFIKSRKAGAVLLGLAVLSSFGRIYIGIHYPLDVLGGAALGALAGFIALGISWALGPIIKILFKVLRMGHLA
ncbi:MAG: hypothetical protein A2Z29_05020 [Chloroflexi bacterium RBG_16_56_11]|nr:MAG: hypothetical protein A2Z29_05020 [Chloroflexi bacterium RBG_16_56_11]